MNALAGIGAVFAALLLAAKTRGFGAPLEEVESRQSFASADSDHVSKATTFLAMAKDLIAKAKFEVSTNDCVRAQKFVTGAQVAIANASAHIESIAHTDKRGFRRTLSDLHFEFSQVQREIQDRCRVA